MILNQNNYIRFFGGVEIVRGVTSSLVYDLHRNGTYVIPSLLYDVFVEFKEKTIHEVKTTFNNEYDEGIDLYLNKFFELELIFETDEKDAFPPNDYSDWDYPLRITNAVLEIPKDNSYHLNNVIKQLNLLGCAYLQLRLVEELDYSFSFFEKVVESLKESRIKVIELMVPEKLVVDQKKIELLFNANLRLSRIVFHSATEGKLMETDDPITKGKVIFARKKLIYNQSDIVTNNTMFYNMLFFSEAIEHNVALNRKVCIDKDGFVKNYLSHAKSFGHVNETTIETILNTDQFKEKWFISNNQIEKCKDCQYRYACHFNSDIETKNEQYFKTENCGFDPYKNEWSSASVKNHSNKGE